MNTLQHASVSKHSISTKTISISKNYHCTRELYARNPLYGPVKSIAIRAVFPPMQPNFVH